MIALYIVLGLFLLVALILLLPITVFLSTEDDFVFTLNYGGIKIVDTRQKEEKTEKSPKQEQESKTSKKQKQNKVKELISEQLKVQKEKRGIKGTIEYYSKILKSVFSKLKFVLKRIKFKLFDLDIAVATDDAAKTAIEYGVVCTAVFPLLSLFAQNTSFKIKNVNISTDFNKTSYLFKLKLKIKTRLIYAVIASVGLYGEFKKLEKGESDE